MPRLLYHRNSFQPIWFNFTLSPLIKLNLIDSYQRCRFVPPGFFLIPVVDPSGPNSGNGPSSLNLFCEVGLEISAPRWSASVRCQVQKSRPRNPTFWHQIVVAISFKQTSSLSKRQLWVQIIVIKVFILLQERSSSPIHIKWVSEEQIRRSSAGLFYSSFLQGLLSPLPYRERYQVVYLFMVILEKGGKCPLDPPAISCKCPYDDLLTICFSLPLSS